MFEITSRTQEPYASICYIRCDWPDGSATRASGVVVGVNDVLTALHVVFDPSRGGWANNVVIYPAADTSPFFTTPFGAFSNVGSMVGRAATWDLNGDGLLTQQESQGDMALLGLTSRIGDVTGWLPVTQLPSDFYGVMAGYPARGTGMMAESVYADASTDYSVYDISSGLGSGASGGPLLYTAGGVTSVVGVLSSGDVNNTVSTYAGLFQQDTWNWLAWALGSNDTLLGLAPGSAPAASPNMYFGTAGADNFTGSAGRDVFNGLGGDDVFDGADNVDTSIYSGTRATYDVTLVSPGVVQVHDQVVSRDGTDLLRNVERVSFSDISLAFDVYGAAGQAYRLYQTAFNRAPDLPGLGFQMNALDSGQALVQVANNFLMSPEFRATYGSLDDSQFVTQLYANVLHRAPDPGGYAYHVYNLSHGYTRADTVVGFSESPENEAALIGAMQGGMAYIA